MSTLGQVSNDREPGKFDFGTADQAQREAITTTTGPLLITAGPGTGKTFTLVQRMIYMISECDIAPEEIMVATFTEKAAKELLTRITNELEKRKMPINVSEMWVGTFHSLCLRIVKEHLDHSSLRTGFKVLDGFDQSYTIYQNYRQFESIEDFEVLFPTKGRWRNAEQLASIFNALSEELVEADSLATDPEIEVRVVGKLYSLYQDLLERDNLLDFSSIQVEACRMLQNHPELLGLYVSKIKYLMIDEYQDTNYIQEQLAFMLADTRQNICVVGDDDQGLYRFRGATIRNILEFPDKFPRGNCKVVSLINNYRSHHDIVKFYNSWMQNTEGSKFKFDWNGYRFDKEIKAAADITTGSPATFKVIGEDDPDDWHTNLLAFIDQLRDEGALTDLNQIAFLFSSVRHPRVTKLAAFLEENGVSVYSPRSAMFFERDEIKLVIGLMLLMFPTWISSLESDEYQWLPENYQLYLISCVTQANEYLSERTSDRNALRNFVIRHGKAHVSLTSPTDYGYAALLYRLLAFDPFASILSTPLDSGMIDLRPTRNLALLTQIIGKFEYLHGVTVLSPKGYTKSPRSIDYFTEKLFNTYLRLLYEGGIAEYEDDSEYAPSGCVSFLTIHQSKGMEFPVVIVDSLSNVPRKQRANVLDSISERYYHRKAFEPEASIKFFDFWRLYYTAFSRAQNILVLTCNEAQSTPSKYFRGVYDQLPRNTDNSVNLGEFKLAPVKDVNLKQAFSFTSHIAVYETCSLQYKFFKELDFQPVRVNAQLFGRLVHQTIEDIHKAALRGEAQSITSENVTTWFEMNYTHLSRAERIYLARPQQKAALEHVQRYVRAQNGDWSKIKQAEVDVSLVKPEYILGGTIDLIQGQDGTVEIIDFKSSKKLDIFADQNTLERYRRQLHLYAHLVEERTGEKVSKMHLYFTGEEDGKPTISWDYSPTAVEATVTVFDDVVHKILKKDFYTQAASLKTCAECDFQSYCAQTTNPKTT